MFKKPMFYFLLVMSLGFFHSAMARHGTYDEEAREAERQEREIKKTSKHKNPAKEVVSGVKEATVGSTSELISETASSTASDTPIIGTLEGARVGGANAVQKAVKGAVKVATLGYADSEKVEVEQPKASSDDVTKFKLGF